MQGLFQANKGRKGCHMPPLRQLGTLLEIRQIGLRVQRVRVKAVPEERHGDGEQQTPLPLLADGHSPYGDWQKGRVGTLPSTHPGAQPVRAHLVHDAKGQDVNGEIGFGLPVARGNRERRGKPLCPRPQGPDQGRKGAAGKGKDPVLCGGGTSGAKHQI